MLAKDFYQSFQTKHLIRYVVTVSVVTSIVLILRHKSPAGLELQRGYSLNIFMVESNVGKRYMSSREACCVESAAFRHPDAQINLYKIDGLYAADDQYVSNLLQQHSNVRILDLNLTELFEGTPLKRWYTDGRISESLYPVEHLSDAARIALLWKYGGIYMDTDTVVVNSMQNFTNAIGIESDYVATGVLAFQRGSPFLYRYMREFATDYDGREWSAQGPYMVTRLLKQVCKVSSLKMVINRPLYCDGIDILPRNKFYPIQWFEWSKLFQTPEEVNVDYSDSYAVHLFGSKSRQQIVRIGKGSFLEELFKKNCPSSYRMMINSEYL